MTKAETALRRLNENISIDQQDGYVVGVEDIDDTEGGIYRVAYFSTPDGTHATAYCLDNPHGENPYPFTVSHLHENGFLCLAIGATEVVESSPLNLQKTVERTRYWAIAFSHLLETGVWVNP